MKTAKRGLRLSVYGLVLGAVYIGLGGSAMAWVEPPRDYPDVAIAGGQASGGEVAFDPSNPNRLVAGIAVGEKCFIRSSIDGGKTWGALVQLPQLPDAICSSIPAVTYAADGSRLYAAYGYKYSKDWRYGVGFSLSTDHGATWSTPTSTSFPEDEWHYYNIHLAAAPDGRWIYLLTTVEAYFGTQIYFSSSADFGSTWTPLGFIAASYSGGPYVGSGSLAVGPKGTVLIAYGESDWPNETPAVVVARSRDRGVLFVYGNAAGQDRATFYSSPEPDIKIGPTGTAHLVYKRPVGTSLAILHNYSLPPYTTWSARPVRLDDNVPEANVGAPHLAVGACENTSVLHAAWAESLGGTNRALYTRKVAEPGYRWSRPLKIDKPRNGVSLSGFAATGERAFATFSTPLFGSRVWSGVTCR